MGVRLQVEAVIKEKMTLQKTTGDRKGSPVRIHIENDAFRDGWLTRGSGTTARSFTKSSLITTDTIPSGTARATFAEFSM